MISSFISDMVGRINARKLLGYEKGTVLVRGYLMDGNKITLELEYNEHGWNKLLREDTGKYDVPYLAEDMVFNGVLHKKGEKLYEEF